MENHQSASWSLFLKKKAIELISTAFFQLSGIFFKDIKATRPTPPLLF